MKDEFASPPLFVLRLCAIKDKQTFDSFDGSKSRDSAFDAVCTMSITIKLKLIGT